MTFGVNYYFNIFVIHDFDSISISYSHTNIQITPSFGFSLFLFFVFVGLFSTAASIMKTIPNFIFKPYFTQFYMYICQSIRNRINMAFVFARSQKTQTHTHTLFGSIIKQKKSYSKWRVNQIVEFRPRDNEYCYGIISLVCSISLFSNDSLLLT